jgi:hypothetical protein
MLVGMRLNYVHLLGFKPLYVGEGKPGREKQLQRTGTYGGWLKNNKNLHICILTVGHFSDSVSSQINEQGLISWIGRGIVNEGPLMNVVPYSTGSGYGPGPEARKRIQERMTGREVKQETRDKLAKHARDKVWSDESRNKISEWSTNLIRTEEHRRKQSEGQINKPIEMCPYCGKTGRKTGGMMKHHFDNCKKRPT